MSSKGAAPFSIRCSMQNKKHAGSVAPLGMQGYAVVVTYLVALPVILGNFHTESQKRALQRRLSDEPWSKLLASPINTP